MGNLNKTVFRVPKMDCPSEERLIRMALEKTDKIKNLQFDLKARELTILHSEADQRLLELLAPLNYGAEIKNSKTLSETEEVLEVSQLPQEKDESKVLKWLLVINGAMFVFELVLGIMAQSTGLIADSLDMFADAAVYSLSLYAVGKAYQAKVRAAKLSGYFQMILAVFAISEVIRRFIYGSDPESNLMIGVAFIALIANATCMYLLHKHRDGEVHMKASWIFSTNDVIANAGVILSGILVKVFASNVPDLVVGGVIAVVVFSGAIRILKTAK